MAVEDVNATPEVVEPRFLLLEIDHSRLCTVREVLKLLSQLTSVRNDGTSMGPSDWAGIMNLLSDETEDALRQGWWARVPDEDNEDEQEPYETL